MARARNWKSVRDEAVRSGALNSERVEELSSRMQSEVQVEQLAELRRLVGITQAQIAESLGVSQAYVSMLERGNIESVKYGLLRQWIETLGGRAYFVAAFKGRSESDESVVVLPAPIPTLYPELTSAVVGEIFSSDKIEHSLREIERFEQQVA